ncbi:MAG: hypothetical protein DHS20C13_02430 [Thermodesulfobacteriota bacterium]|nr:MAG: hypothetical protein DHS20C13_02430 [Thermodesulfobacteriota bacterium]
MRKGIIKSISAVLVLFVFMTLIASSAFAARQRITITEVFVNFDTQSISIMGENFDFRSQPTTVSLGGFGNLNITTETPTLIVVDFPDGGIPQGDYLLKVSTGLGPRKNAQQSITIGAQGPQGDMGDQGDQGAQGPQGPAGPQGPTGATGPQGPQGSSGPPGPQGAQGNPGPIGATGPAGADGVDGADGAQGPAGQACWDIDNDNVCNLTTEDADGNGTCNVNDCIGPEGPMGLQGEIGPAGPQGIQGVAGADGATGPQGLQGDMGPMGPAGPTGADGSDGNDGAPGADGSNGLNTLVAENPFLLVTCAGGGKGFSYGLDDNGNGSLNVNPLSPENEVDGSFQVCDGEDGTDGSTGVSGYQRTNTVVGTSLGPGGLILTNQVCAAGKNILGGGCSSGNSNIAVTVNQASADNEWACTFINTTGSSQSGNMTVSMICADVD